jgi:hypothetical protein
MGTQADSGRSERRARNAKLFKEAYAMLEQGKDPDTVEAHLRRGGLSEKAAGRMVQRADDRLQGALHGGSRARGEGRCHRCDERLSAGAGYCDACGARVIDDVDREWKRTQLEPHLKQGRQALVAMAVIYALTGIVFALILDAPAVLVVNLALSAIHFGLWRWAFSSLLPAVVTALALFVTVHAAEAIIDPSSIVRGIILKVIILVVLYRAVRAGLEARPYLERA